MTAVRLDQRGIVEVAGPEAGALLQRLVTNDVDGLGPGTARYAALLTPQGKIVSDFLVCATGENTFWLDCPRPLAPDLARKLTLYRLRAQVTIVDRSQDLAVWAVWPERPTLEAMVVQDPRHHSLGYRVIAAGPMPGLESEGDEAAYRDHRIMAGVPEGGIDFAYGDTFPHEANLDRLNGLDFTKGCYVGQEVVSRVEHRGTARKRVTPVMFQGRAPSPGTELSVGHIVIGTMGSAVDGAADEPGRGLAMVRIDRAAEAAAEGAQVLADGVHLGIALGAAEAGSA